LARHLKAVHGITAEEYRVLHPGALIRAQRVTQNRQEALKAGRASAAYEGTKKVVCPACGDEHEVHKLSGIVPCAACKTKVAEPRPPRASPLKGRPLSEATRQKMSENAGRWNKGLTKEMHPSLAAAAEKMQTKVPWNWGKTADLDAKVAETARKLRYYSGENRPWDNGLAAGLTLRDFQPFMDAEGRVDHHKVVEITGVSWVTVRKYIVDLGLVQTKKYIEDAADDRTIRLDKEVLEAFKLGNGKVSIGKAMSVTGHAFKVIQRECERHRLETFHRHIRQTLCLDAVSAALGGVPYEMEWKAWRFTNPKTGHRFRFDGYFPDLGLVVEFHGHQHYTFPNAFMPDEGYLSEYEALRERDRVKRALIEAAPDLTYFEVTEDEPYMDVSYLRGRLYGLGIASP
jgi:ribosomal protein L37AE/L43A